MYTTNFEKGFNRNIKTAFDYTDRLSRLIDRNPFGVYSVMRAQNIQEELSNEEKKRIRQAVIPRQIIGGGLLGGLWGAGLGAGLTPRPLLGAIGGGLAGAALFGTIPAAISSHILRDSGEKTAFERGFEKQALSAELKLKASAEKLKRKVIEDSKDLALHPEEHRKQVAERLSQQERIKEQNKRTGFQHFYENKGMTNKNLDTMQGHEISHLVNNNPNVIKSNANILPSKHVNHIVQNHPRFAAEHLSDRLTPSHVEHLSKIAPLELAKHAPHKMSPNDMLNAMNTDPKTLSHLHKRLSDQDLHTLIKHKPELTHYMPLDRLNTKHLQTLKQSHPNFLATNPSLEKNILKRNPSSILQKAFSGLKSFVKKAEEENITGKYYMGTGKFAYSMSSKSKGIRSGQRHTPPKHITPNTVTEPPSNPLPLPTVSTPPQTYDKQVWSKT